MAKKGVSDGAGNKAANGRQLPKMHWVNYDLTAADKERLHDEKLQDKLAEFDVESLVFEGFKYSISLDEKNNSFVASITFKRAGSEFYNWCLTGRGSTPIAARISLLYRHLVLAQGDWSFFSQPSDGEQDLFF